MSRTTLATDRAATLLVALITIGAAITAIAWWSDTLTWLPTTIDLSTAATTTQQPWWPWAAGAAGLIAVTAGTRWLIAHLPDRGVSDLTLTGSGPNGKLHAAANPVARAAAHALATTPGIRSATGKIHHERGQLVAHLTATIETTADLHTIATAADQTATDLGTVLGRHDLHCQIHLKTTTRTRAQPRVH